MNLPGFDITTLTIIMGIIVFSVSWFLMFKSKTQKELHLSLLLIVIFLLIRLGLQFIGDSAPKLYLYLHVTSLLVLALAIIRTVLKVFIVYFLKTHTINMPKIMQDLLQLCTFLIVAIIILREHLKLDTSILVTSSVLSIVIGLALQDTLGNFFAGLAIQMQRPFEEGDWILFNDKLGQIKEIDWRAIRMRTLDLDIIVIPNSEIAKSSLTNYSKPTKLHRVVIPIGISYNNPPNFVKQVILNILDEEPEVLSHPTPTILLVKYNDSSIDYEIRVYTENFSRYRDIMDSIYTKIWYKFKRNDIVIPFPIRDIYLHEVKPENEYEKLQNIIHTLKTVDFLNHLSDEELGTLAKGVILQKFAANEVVIKQGESGTYFYLINEGEVEVIITDDDGNTTTLKKLSCPAFFGELSLLTGSKTNATIVALSDCEFITISPETFKSILMTNPHIAHKVSTIITNRQIEVELSAKSKTTEELASEIAEKSSNLLNRIKRFFGL